MGAFEAAKADDEAATELLEKAKDALTKYYKDNKIEMLQGQQMPKDPDAMPDATFKKKDSNANESKGIIGIMDLLIEDLKAEIENGTKNEEAAIEEFEKQMKAAEKLIDALKEK